LSNYKIFETDEFTRKIEKIPGRDKSFIEIKEEPHYGNNIKKLIDYKPETWRYRIGKYRLFYSIDENEKIIYTLSIDLRKDSY